jgi:hypothetical protein
MSNVFRLYDCGIETGRRRIQNPFQFSLTIYFIIENKEKEYVNFLAQYVEESTIVKVDQLASVTLLWSTESTQQI